MRADPTPYEQYISTIAGLKAENDELQRELDQVRYLIGLLVIQAGGEIRLPLNRLTRINDVELTVWQDEANYQRVFKAKE